MATWAISTTVYNRRVNQHQHNRQKRHLKGEKNDYKLTSSRHLFHLPFLFYITFFFTDYRILTNALYTKYLYLFVKPKHQAHLRLLSGSVFRRSSAGGGGGRGGGVCVRAEAVQTMVYQTSVWSSQNF